MFWLLICVLILTLYFYGTRNFKYWERKGVKHDKPVVFLGTVLRQFLQLVSIGDDFARMYKCYPNERYVGIYIGNDSGLLIRDPELIKHVLVTDFRHFHQRGILPRMDAVEPMLKNLFTVDGDLWKLLRKRLTPAFTSGKLKAMFPLIVEMANRLLVTADKSAESGKEVDVRDLMARYTTDFVGACGFGIDSDSLKNENSAFRKLGKRIFTVTKRDAFMAILKKSEPAAFKHLHFLAPEVEKLTVAVVRQVLEKRNYTVSGRNDFIDLLLDLQQKGKMVGESVENYNEDGTPRMTEIELNELLIIAQVFIFFAAGFETSSSGSSFLLHELAFHPEIQKRCQEEVDEVLNRYDGKLCFDAVKDMKYLEMAFRETLRLHPSPGFLLRKCSKPYRFPGTDLTIDEGVGIVVSLQALHRDPNYFEDPDSFKPERFLPENVGNIKNYVYMPFGEGPRACIGARMGLMQSLAGAATILHKFTVTPSVNTLRNPVVDPTSTIVQNIVGGLPLTLTLR